MTYSILVRDPATGRMGGAVATGNLCAGGWVLRGRHDVGMSASQGAASSTLWGEAAMALLAAGTRVEDLVAQVTTPDPGREARQLSVLDPAGRAAVFTGRDNEDFKGASVRQDLVAAGNVLTGAEVLTSVVDGYVSAEGPMQERLVAALAAGQAEGGDSRGLMSAALMVVGHDMPPMTLRIDFSADPIGDLKRLLDRARQPDYVDWLATLPTGLDPYRR